MQSKSYKDVEYCWRDQEREVVKGGLQRSEGKQGRGNDRGKDIKLHAQKERKGATNIHALEMNYGGEM